MRWIKNILRNWVCPKDKTSLLPPKGGTKIKAANLTKLLKPFNIYLSGGTSDSEYKLLPYDELVRFLSWYKDNHGYTLDDYDCDKYAWVMRAEAIKWTEGKYAWGYLEGEGIDPTWMFPNHAFCFIVTDDLSVWFVDELELAAPKDEPMEAYPLKVYMAKI